MFALITGAFCHDLEHPGTTNQLELATMSPLALLYNDKSPLENHSASVGFELLLHFRLLDGLNPKELASFRAMFLTAILATDMAAHKHLIEETRAHLPHHVCANTALSLSSPALRKQGSGSGGGGAAPPPAPLGSSLAERCTLVAFILHCADLSTCLLPPSLSQATSGCLSHEFEAQASQELALGLPVSVYLARTPKAKAEMEIGFLRFVVAPLFLRLADWAPSAAFTLARLDANMSAWEAMAGVAADAPLPLSDKWRLDCRSAGTDGAAQGGGAGGERTASAAAAASVTLASPLGGWGGSGNNSGGFMPWWGGRVAKR